jgi:hypothetical protein
VAIRLAVSISLTLCWCYGLGVWVRVLSLYSVQGLDSECARPRLLVWNSSLFVCNRVVPCPSSSPPSPHTHSHTHTCVGVAIFTTGLYNDGSAPTTALSWLYVLQR